MNHSINLLEPNEIRYLSAAESNPIFKLAAVGGVMAIIGLVAIYYFSLQGTIAKAEHLSTRWADIETDVADANLLNEKRQRLEKGLQTLQGWKASRVDFNSLFSYMVTQIPGSLEDIQFTRLEVSETMRGLRNQPPNDKKADFHPLQRNVNVNLKGKLRSPSPARLLRQFQQNLINGEAPVKLEKVVLDRYVQLRDENGDFNGQTTFAFTLRLTPLEVMP